MIWGSNVGATLAVALLRHFILLLYCFELSAVWRLASQAILPTLSAKLPQTKKAPPNSIDNASLLSAVREGLEPSQGG